MILAVTEKFHDYQPTQYFLDANLLDPGNYVDKRILEECVAQGTESRLVVHIDATNHETDPAFGGKDPVASEAAKRDHGPADKMLLLTIYFDA